MAALLRGKIFLVLQSLTSWHSVMQCHDLLYRKSLSYCYCYCSYLIKTVPVGVVVDTNNKVVVMFAVVIVVVGF